MDIRTTYLGMSKFIQSQSLAQIMDYLNENSWLSTYTFKNSQSTKIYNQDMNILHIIFKKGRVDVLKALMDPAASPWKQLNYKIVNKCNWTPLYFACKHGHLEIVQLLLKHDLELLAHKCKKGSPLLLACKSNNFELVKYLASFDSVDVDYTDEERICAVYMATYVGNENMVKYLIEEKKARIDIVTPLNGGNLLHAACTFEFENLISYYLQLGFNLSDTDDEGNTALHLFSATTNNPQFVDMLIVKGANLWLKNNEGLNVIGYAEKHDNLFICEYLSEKYAQSGSGSLLKNCVIF